MIYRRHAYKTINLWLALLLLFISGCVATQAAKLNNDVTLDQTFGNYDEVLEPGLILITVTPDQYSFLTKVDTKLTKDKLPKEYNNFLKRMSAQYGLTRVADWPLPAIDIHCIVFKNTGVQPRNLIVKALNSEPSIESAQVVHRFDIQTTNYYKIISRVRGVQLMTLLS